MPRTPLHTAVEQENLALVESLLESGANPNVRDETNWDKAPLHLIRRDTPTTQGIVTMLTSNPKTIVDIKDRDRCTPLEYAARLHLPNIAALLIAAGANIYEPHIFGNPFTTAERELRALEGIYGANRPANFQPLLAVRTTMNVFKDKANEIARQGAAEVLFAPRKPLTWLETIQGKNYPVSMKNVALEEQRKNTYLKRGINLLRGKRAAASNTELAGVEPGIGKLIANFAGQGGRRKAKKTRRVRKTKAKQTRKH